MQHFWRAFLLAKNQWGRRIIAGISMLVDSGSLIVIPLILRRIFDSLTLGQPAEVIPIINQGIFQLLVIGLLRFFFTYLEIYYQEGTGSHISHDIRKLLFGRILYLPFSFFDRKRTGDLMSVLTRDVDAVRDGTGWVIMLVVVNLMILVGITVTMFILHPLLTLIVFITLPILGMLAIWYSRRIGPLYQELQRQSGDLHTTAQENISGIRVVKAFTRAPEELGKFGRVNDFFFTTRLRIARLSSLVHPTLDFLGTLVGMVALGAGGIFVIRGDITLGTMIAFTNFADFLIWPIRQIGWLSEMVQRSIAGAQRVYQIIDEKDTAYNAHETITQPLQGDIRFENVFFAYPNGKEDALKNFSLHIPAGGTVCLLGLTGSGKTTVANLIARFYPPSQGRITIDGIDISRWHLDALRSQIGFVFQDNFLFSTTLAENVTMGKPIETDTIIQATQAAQADFTNHLPDGLESFVGERGIGLSGGERQRIAIARAILNGPPILIFDDSSASLDMKTEAALQKALAELYVGRTVIIIAQRVSTAQHANHIVVMDAGQIAEQGTHLELLGADGIYARLNRIQSEGGCLTMDDQGVTSFA